MSVHSENGISFLSRLRDHEDSIDPQVMNNSYVYVINISETDLIDANAFIHYICKNIFNKYSHFKPNRSSSPIVHFESTPEEDLGIEFLNESLNESQRSLELFRLSGSTLSNSDKCSQDLNPMILVFDGLEAFNIRHFSNLVSNVKQLRQLKILKAYDSTQLITAISKELPLNLALNMELKLVIIYSITSNICPKIMDKLIELLSSLIISVRILLVSDRISKTQTKELKNKPFFDLLSVKYLDNNRIEIESNRTKEKVVRDMYEPLFISQMPKGDG